MNDPANTPAVRLSWKFSSTFWFANVAELFERATFHAMFISLSLFLTRNVGFDDIGAGWIGAFFAGILYFLPVFLGTLADKNGRHRLSQPRAGRIGPVTG